MQTFIRPYRLGDVVVFNKDTTWAKKGTKAIILETYVQDINRYIYSTEYGAWHEHEDLDLVRECDVKSLKKYLKEITAF